MRAFSLSGLASLMSVFRASFISGGSVCHHNDQVFIMLPSWIAEACKKQRKLEATLFSLSRELALSPVYAEENEFKLATKVSLSRLGLLTYLAL